MPLEKLYLDDIRNPYNDEWTLFRDPFLFLDYFKNNLDNIGSISLDHDLAFFLEDGKDFTGYDVIKEIVGILLDTPTHKPLEVIVHSANPVGKKNILSYWQNYLKHKER